MANHLRVTIVTNGEVMVDISLPIENSQLSIIELISENVLNQIEEGGISIERIHNELLGQHKLRPSPLFKYNEKNRKISMWLE